MTRKPRAIKKQKHAERDFALVIGVSPQNLVLCKTDKTVFFFHQILYLYFVLLCVAKTEICNDVDCYERCSLRFPSLAKDVQRLVFLSGL